MNTLNKYIWSLSPLFRKLLIVLTKYVVYVLCLLLLIDYSEKLIAYYNNDFFEGWTDMLIYLLQYRSL